MCKIQIKIEGIISKNTVFQYYFVLKCNFIALVPLAKLPIKLPKIALLNQGHCKSISEQTVTLTKVCLFVLLCYLYPRNLFQYSRYAVVCLNLRSVPYLVLAKLMFCMKPTIKHLFFLSLGPD